MDYSVLPLLLMMIAGACMMVALDVAGTAIFSQKQNRSNIAITAASIAAASCIGYWVMRNIAS